MSKIGIFLYIPTILSLLGKALFFEFYFIFEIFNIFTKDIMSVEAANKEHN
jgi:hypothetical protein